MSLLTISKPILNCPRINRAVPAGTGPIHFLAGWHKRRPEPGFNFVKFGFACVFSFRLSLFRFLCCSYICFTTTSQVIGSEEEFVCTSQTTSWEDFF